MQRGGSKYVPKFAGATVQHTVNKLENDEALG